MWDVGNVCWLMSGGTKLSYPDGYYPVIADVLEGREYPVEMLPSAFSPTLIIDVGANVGAAAVYFSQKYPEAEIHSIEPFSRNLEHLEKNVARLPNVKIHPLALHAYDHSSAPMYDRVGNSAGYSLQSTGLDAPQDVGRVQVRSASNYFAENKWFGVSILKLDAEGSEPAILMDLFSNIAGIEILFIFLEYHTNSHKEMIRRLLEPDYEVKEICAHCDYCGSLLFSNRDFLKAVASMTKK